ncbi:MAG TPA: hypothetical protein VN924_26485 [Bryobacteraceae bacterium]|jgi:hypothetical protein|nr:hypothetical protein [Bryobacteraceae bacterium]
MTGIPAGWNDFFVAEAGASAALAGLVFVAVSINLARILEFAHLPMRVVEALAALLSVLIVSTFALVPEQPLWAYGVEMGGTGLGVLALKSTALIRMRRAGSPNPRPVLRFLVNEITPLPFVTAGVLLTAGSRSGIYWIVPGTLLSFAAGLFDVWVLLIEIKR